MSKIKEKNNYEMKFSKLLIILMLICSVIAPITLISSADVSAVTFLKTYSKDGKFHMPIEYMGQPYGTSATISAVLVNGKGEIIETFKTYDVDPGVSITYSRVFTKLPTGTYYLKVACEFMNYEPIVNSLKITHKSTNPSVELTNTYQYFNDAGDANQLFRIDYANAINKKINIQIYDQYGTLIHKNMKIAKYANGWVRFDWNYYPTSGGLMVPSDVYIIKYWIDGQSPKQLSFEVYLEEE